MHTTAHNGRCLVHRLVLSAAHDSQRTWLHRQRSDRVHLHGDQAFSGCPCFVCPAGGTYLRQIFSQLSAFSQHAQHFRIPDAKPKHAGRAVALVRHPRQTRNVGNPACDRQSGPAGMRACMPTFSRSAASAFVCTAVTRPLRTTDIPNRERHRQPIPHHTGISTHRRPERTTARSCSHVVRSMRSICTLASTGRREGVAKLYSCYPAGDLDRTPQSSRRRVAGDSGPTRK